MNKLKAICNIQFSMVWALSIVWMYINHNLEIYGNLISVESIRTTSILLRYWIKAICQNILINSLAYEMHFSNNYENR